jgi:hypothetical protein
MRKLVISAVTAIAATGAASAARAMPVSAQIARSAGNLVEVRGFCGLGWHRGFYGACVPNGVPYAYRPYAYGPYAYVSPAPAPVRCWWIETAYGPRRVCS